MKKAKRLSIILALALILSSFEVIGVFALPENTDEDQALLTTQEEITAKTPVTPIAAPALTAQAGYNAVVLKWTAVENTSTDEAYTNAATSYKVYFNGKEVKETTDLTYTVSGLDPYASTPYSFAVAAVNAAGVGPQATASGKPVRDIAYALKIKKSGTLKSHAGKKAKMKVRSGQTVYAYGFAGGKYILRNGSSVFYVARTRVGKKSAVFDKTYDYTREEAQNYVNGKGLSSSTGSLIWVSTYTQHLYLFTGRKGAWVCQDDWNISTGTASTPTPTSISGLKKVTKHTKTRHGIKWWSFFHGTAALHGIKGNWAKKLGRPASNGCIRNPVAKAKILYKLRKGTRVAIF